MRQSVRWFLPSAPIAALSCWVLAFKGKLTFFRSTGEAVIKLAEIVRDFDALQL